MSDYRSVTLISSMGTVRRPRVARSRRGQNEHSYAFVVAALTLVSTAVAFYDLLLLAANA